MTGYCSTRYALYMAWVRSTGSDKAQAKRILENHHRTCEICQSHAEDMTAWARAAVMPEFEEDEL